jgi:hypothetical protein
VKRRWTEEEKGRGEAERTVVVWRIVALESDLVAETAAAEEEAEVGLAFASDESVAAVVVDGRTVEEDESGCVAVVAATSKRLVDTRADWPVCTLL